MSSKSQSTGKGRRGQRLSLAMDVDPTSAEEFRPAEDATPEPTAAEEAKATPARPARARGKEKAREAAPVVAVSAPAPVDASAPSSVDPAVQVVNGRTYVLSGEDLLPEGSRVQMTIALTAMERHRWTRYAEARRMSLIEVLRERMAEVFLGDEA